MVAEAHYIRRSSVSLAAAPEIVLAQKGKWAKPADDLCCLVSSATKVQSRLSSGPSSEVEVRVMLTVLNVQLRSGVSDMRRISRPST